MNVYESFKSCLQYKQVEVQASQSSPFTGRTNRKQVDTYISSTIATETTAVAAVPSYEDTPIFDLLREQSGKSIGNEKTSCVNSYISARKGDKQRIYSLETPEQQFQINLRC
jgi:hypothetical protein